MIVENQVVYAEMKEDGIQVIFLNQPKKKNAISADMMKLLHGILVEADGNDEVRAIILRGAGENFSSGGDLSQSPSEELCPENARKTLKHYTRVIKTMRSISKPIITMVDGYAVGGAFSMTLASDLVCVSDRAVFMPAFCQIGIVPEMAMMKYLPELVGPQRAKEIIFLGGKFTGEQMRDLGLVNRIFKAESLEEETMKLAQELAAMPAASIQVVKGIMNSLADTDLDTVLEAELTASPFCTTTKAYAETMKKFI